MDFTKVEKQFDASNFQFYINSRGSARLINRIDEIISAVQEVGINRFFGCGEIEVWEKIVEGINPTC